MDAEEAISLILSNECFNPIGNNIDRSSPREYHLEGHCASYTIIAERTQTGYNIVDIRIDPR